MLLSLATWPEIEARLEQSTSIVLPIGSFEQHGPTGLIGTDALCPEIIAHKASEIGDILVGPTLNVGIAQHHMSFPGSMAIKPSTMITLMNDWMDSLSHHGFKKILWLNGHGGNIATINAAIAEFYHKRNYNPSTDGDNALPQNILRGWWELEGVDKFCMELYPEGHGLHATASEIAVTYSAYPSRVKNEVLDPKIAPAPELFFDANDYRRKFPDGRIGSDPSQATVEDGEKIVDLAARALIKELAGEA